MAYRDDASEVAREARWTIFRFLPIFVFVVIGLAVLGFGLKSMGLFGSTIVERKVFENSYQRSEALKSQIATDEAVLAEIEQKLMNPNLDSNTVYNLKAQAGATRIRIATTKGKQQ